MWLSSLFALLLSDANAWIVGSKPSDDLRMWDGLTLNGGVTLLNLKNNLFLSLLDEMQNPESSTCLHSYVTPADSPLSHSPCIRLRHIASFDLRLAATFRSFLSVSSPHRDEIVRGAVRSSELFRHAPPTAEVLDLQWHNAVFPRSIFVHKLPQMLQEYKLWDLSCSSLPAKSWLSFAGCPVIKPITAPDGGENAPTSDKTGISLPSSCGLPSNAVADLSRAKVQRSDAEWQAMLSPLQYRVTRQQGTEPAFKNLYWNNHEDGVYFSACSETPLFDSRDKFDSGTGWPSFTRPLHTALVDEIVDNSYGMRRLEARSVVDGAHLGHVFEDGPAAAGGRRYCINSASLRFVPRSEYDRWLSNHTQRLQAQRVDARSRASDALPPPLLHGNAHYIEMPTRYSKWRPQKFSEANCSLTSDGLLCEYPVRSFSVLMHTCSAAAVRRMMASTPCSLHSNMNSLYTLLLPSFTDCSLDFSDWNSAPNSTCFTRSVSVPVPCSSTQYACSAKYLLSSRLSDEATLLPPFDYIIGLPAHVSFCPFWLDQLAFYVASSSDAIWWLGVSSIAAFPRLFDDFFILKGGDISLLEYIQQPHAKSVEHSASTIEEPASILYSSITADAAAVANHASSMVRPIPLVERLAGADSSCDCAAVAACVV